MYNDKTAATNKTLSLLSVVLCMKKFCMKCEIILYLFKETVLVSNLFTNSNCFTVLDISYNETMHILMN